MILTSCKVISLMSKNARTEILIMFKRTDNYKKNVNCQTLKKIFAATAQELILTCQLVTEITIKLTEAV